MDSQDMNWVLASNIAKLTQLQGAYTKTGHSISLTNLTFNFKTSIVVKKNNSISPATSEDYNFSIWLPLMWYLFLDKLNNRCKSV